MTLAYPVDELLRVRQNVKASEEVLRKINESEAGIKDPLLYDGQVLKGRQHLATTKQEAICRGHIRMLASHEVEHPERTFASVNDDSQPLLMGDDLEHVLRSSSFGSTATTTRRGRSTSTATNPWEGFEQPPADGQTYHLRPRTRPGGPIKFSPTPSLKRTKIEKLIKEHGSPPGIRVTAGGRIVPNGLSPLESPRFDQEVASAYFSNFPPVPKLEPGQIPSIDALRQIHGYVVNIGGRQICQVVDNKLMPVGEEGGPIRLYVPPRNLAVPSGLPPNLVPAPSQDSTQPQFFAAPGGQSDQELMKQLNVLEMVHNRLDEELKQLDRNEVLHRESLTSASRTEIRKNRVNLTNRMDETRRGIADLRRMIGFQAAQNQARSKSTGEREQPAHFFQTQAYHDLPYQPPPVSPLPSQWASSVPPYGFAAQPITATNVQSPQLFIPSLDLAGPQATSPFQHQLQPVSALAQTESASGELQQHPENIESHAAQANPNDRNFPSAGRAKSSSSVSGLRYDTLTQQNRRSHAVPIKKPEDVAGKSKTSLDPLSPIYEPANTVISSHPLRSKDVDLFGADTISQNLRAGGKGYFNQSSENIAPTSSHPYRRHGQHDGAIPEGDDILEHRTNDSSATTADFFPEEAQHHSSHKWPYSPGDDMESKDTWVRHDYASENRITPLRSSFERDLLKDSPEGGGYVNPPNTENRQSSLENLPPGTYGTQARHRVNTQSEQAPASPPYRSSRSSHHHEPTDIEGSQEVRPKCSVKELVETSTVHEDASPSRSQRYWDGYNEALQNFQAWKSSNPDFYSGFSDALEKVRSSEGPGPLRIQTQLDSPGAGVGTTKGRPMHSAPLKSGFRLSSMSRTASLPSFTPEHSKSFPESPTRVERNEPAESVGLSFDSAIATPRRKIEPYGSLSARQIGTQTSRTELRHTEPTSPLSLRDSTWNPPQRPIGSERKQRLNSPKTGTGFDQQRFAGKVVASVVPSGDHSRGWIRPQLDGSNEDDDSKPLTGKDINTEDPASSPCSGNKAKTKSPGSPVKRASSAVGHLLQISSKNRKATGDHGPSTMPSGQPPKEKKDIDPAKLSGAEKQKWAAKWRKNFQALKAEEQEDIAKYQRQHPAPRQ